MQSLTIEDDLLVAEQLDQRVEQALLLRLRRIGGLQRQHHIGAGLLRVRAAGLVFVRLVQRPLPLAADALEAAGGRPLLALVLLVALQRLAGVLLAAELTFAGQLGDGLLDGQIAAGRRLGDFDAAVRAGGDLVAQSVRMPSGLVGAIGNDVTLEHLPAVRQQMGETGGAHQMAHLALGGLGFVVLGTERNRVRRQRNGIVSRSNETRQHTALTNYCSLFFITHTVLSKTLDRTRAHIKYVRRK